MSDALEGLKLYGNSNSGNCLKPQWLANHLGIAYEWVEIDIFDGGAQTDEFLALNPAGQVPLAVFGDGRRLPQSNAILLYLAEIAGSDLLPDDPFQRAQVNSWLFWEQYSHEPFIAVRIAKLKYHKVPEDELDPVLLTKGRRALGIMEMQLTYSEYLVGETLTVADIALLAYTRKAHDGGFDLKEFPYVERWVARCEAELGLPHEQPIRMT